MLPNSSRQRAPDPGATDRSTRSAQAAPGRGRARVSALGRRIIIFNLIALNCLVLGVLYLGGSQETLLRQRGKSLMQSADLMAEVITARLPDGMAAEGPPFEGPDGAFLADILSNVAPRAGSEAWLFDAAGRVLAHYPTRMPDGGPRGATASTPIMNTLGRIAGWLPSVGGDRTTDRAPSDSATAAQAMVDFALADGPHLRALRGSRGTELRAAAPIFAGSAPVAVLVLTDEPGAVDALVRAERERVLRIFLIAMLISVGLSLTLASAISTPLTDLAMAAETGRDGTAGREGPDAGRVRIPDLTARPDEIGRLSDSLRGMVAALYQRIESNEQFAADVAHEIKNPLTSLRCAVDTMRETTQPDQRDRLLEVIEHDVRRLDRLITDISRASRLDSDLVKEEQIRFDLLEMLRTVALSLGPQADKKGVTFITDLPDQPIAISGLEARLAQVFDNLVTNAISFCDAGDTIRVWARRRAERVLVVVEDTGPGIPDGALEKIFERFYSSRPESEFGNHSGLGLAISKQIVEAHDGVIWAENIRPTEADATSDPQGVRFVVGLSV
ncbi:ATP-binding protein [Roseovarius sp. D22-M7]